jgi:hypothetical protein
MHSARAQSLRIGSRAATQLLDARFFGSGRMYDINWFAVLGVSPSASPGEIKAAFREHAKSMHPDVAPSGNQDTQDKFKMISEAGYPARVCVCCPSSSTAGVRLPQGRRTAGAARAALRCSAGVLFGLSRQRLERWSRRILQPSC